MVRTIVSLEKKDKTWLDERAAAEGVPMTELIRRALRLLRERDERRRPPLEDLLRQTSGTWTHGEGLAYQKARRDEW